MPHRSPCPRPLIANDFPLPERLVGLGFRYWNAGLETGDIACWEHAWRIYDGALGAAAARDAVAHLGCWVRAIRSSADRPIVTQPRASRRFCDEECIAISLVAASQHQVCPAMRACAFALLGPRAVDSIVAATDEFAATLVRVDQHLKAHSVELAAHVLAPRCEPASPVRH